MCHIGQLTTFTVRPRPLNMASDRFGYAHPRNTLCSRCMTRIPESGPITHTEARSERKQTDESLRLERQHSDSALEQLAAIDAAADDVISRARDRADTLL